jgi:hypothetical protein
MQIPSGVLAITGKAAKNNRLHRHNFRGMDAGFDLSGLTVCIAMEEDPDLPASPQSATP